MLWETRSSAKWKIGGCAALAVWQSNSSNWEVKVGEVELAYPPYFYSGSQLHRLHSKGTTISPLQTSCIQLIWEPLEYALAWTVKSFLTFLATAIVLQSNYFTVQHLADMWQLYSVSSERSNYWYKFSKDLKIIVNSSFDSQVEILPERLLIAGRESILGFRHVEVRVLLISVPNSRQRHKRQLQ